MKKTRLILLILCICTLITFRAYQYYAPPLLRQPYTTNHDNHDDTLRIAYIGDSWAYMHNNHSCTIASIFEDSLYCPVSVYSYGICGLTSKEIYESIFDDPDYKQFLRERYYNFCFVSSGINDTYKKMSTSYYKKSMEGIIDFFLSNHIRPIILEIPDYNIIKAYNHQKGDRKLLRRFSMLINNTSLNCKQKFRDALDELISEKGYQDKVSIIRYKSWNNNYENDLKRLYLYDGMHLNEDGYSTLDSMIVKTVIDHMASKHNLSYNIQK